MRKLITTCFLIVFYFTGVGECHYIHSGHAINSYPSAGATSVNILTSIGITYSESLDEALVSGDTVSVIGSISGKYTGTLTLSANNQTLIFKPFHHFIGGEKVTVRIGSLKLHSEGYTVPDSFSFTTALSPARIDTSFHSDDPILEWELHRNSLDARLFTNSTQSIPDTGGLPRFNILKYTHPYPGQIYLGNIKLQSPQNDGYRMILNADGSIEYSYGNGHHYFIDFKPYPNGTYSALDGYTTTWYVFDTAFRVLDSLVAKNGYATDGHEFRITPEGNYMIFANDYESIDMSKIVPNGLPGTVVIFSVIQEIDRKGNLIFEWNSKDHFKITDASHEQLIAQSIDFCHANSIEFDLDSNLLISSRNMDEITKINRKTGAIIWRMGGNNNQFKFYGDTLPFSHQHAFRRIANGNYTMFDNGNYRYNSKPFSRAVEFNLNRTAKRATEVWEFRHSPDVYGFGLGYTQRLPNGNSLISWGFSDSVAVTEVTSKNETVFEMRMDIGNYCYRFYKFDSNYVHSGSLSTSVDLLPSIRQELVFFPNPVHKSAMLELITDVPGNMSLSFFDEKGVLVSKKYYPDLYVGKNMLIWEPGALVSGNYFFEGTLGKSFYRGKCILDR